MKFDKCFYARSRRYNFVALVFISITLLVLLGRVVAIPSAYHQLITT